MKNFFIATFLTVLTTVHEDKGKKVNNHAVKFRKYAPQNRNVKNPPLNHPPEYKPRGGLQLELALEYKVKQSKKW